MSKVAIKGNASGTGTFTIEAPNSNTDRTLNLPDEAGTVITSASDIEAQVKTATNATGTAPIYACRAWVNFNGTGTVAIRASGNVSSITDIGSGDYIVNLATAMPDTNYAALGTWSTRDDDWNNAWDGSMVIGGTYSSGAFTAYYSTTQIGVVNYGGGTYQDVDQVNIAIFR